MSRHLLNYLTRGRTGILADWLRGCRQPRICWYPSSGPSDFRDILYLHERYREFNPANGAEPATPDIFLHSDVQLPHDDGWKSGERPPIGYADKETTVVVAEWEQLPSLPRLPVHEDLVDPGLKSEFTGCVFFAWLEINCSRFGKFRRPMIYACAENAAFCANVILRHQGRISHVVQSRYGHCFGGSKAGPGWITPILPRLGTEVFISDDQFDDCRGVDSVYRHFPSLIPSGPLPDWIKLQRPLKAWEGYGRVSWYVIPRPPKAATSEATHLLSHQDYPLAAGEFLPCHFRDRSHLDIQILRQNIAALASMPNTGGVGDVLLSDAVASYCPLFETSAARRWLGARTRDSDNEHRVVTLRAKPVIMALADGGKQEALAIAAKRAVGTARIICLVELAKGFARQRLMNRAVQQVERLSTDEERAAAFARLAFDLATAGDHDAAVVFANRSAELSTGDDEADSEYAHSQSLGTAATALATMGSRQCNQEWLTRSREMFRASIEKATQIDDTDKQEGTSFEALNAIVESLVGLGFDDLAMQAAGKHEIAWNASIAFATLARNFAERGNLEMAFEAIERIQFDDARSLAQSWIAPAVFHHGQTARALGLINDSIKAVKALPRHLQSKALAWVATAYWQVDDRQRSRRVFRRCLEIANRSDPIHQSGALYETVQHLLRIGEYNTMFRYLAWIEEPEFQSEILGEYVQTILEDPDMDVAAINEIAGRGWSKEAFEFLSTISFDKVPCKQRARRIRMLMNLCPESEDVGLNLSAELIASHVRNGDWESARGIAQHWPQLGLNAPLMAA